MADRPSWLREIEHTGDTGVEVEAPTRAELFARAALAMARLMVEEEGIEPVERREVAARGVEDAALLHDLLAGALNLFLSDGFIWRDAAATEDGERVVLTLTGERFDRRRHTLLGEIKAVTYHQLSVAKSDTEGWRARVIFDV
ncbi:MAG TPA: archease [Candidatus Binataceae bacterium]|jgi:SHS2 domain-containing protein|nr:archease [Candidatus Binataceae bacterium]